MSIGQATRRVEGPRKVTGTARYTADHYPDGALHAVMVGSPLAAGRVSAIDIEGASAVPGVLRVLTHMNAPKLPKLKMPAAITHMPLQSDEVQWEGQAVALVIAETLEAAEEAATLVTRIDRADLTRCCPERGDRRRHRIDGYWIVKGTKGDRAGASAADVSAEQSYFQPTRNHNPMETSACVASGRVTSSHCGTRRSSSRNRGQVLGDGIRPAQGKSARHRAAYRRWVRRQGLLLAA